jgi:hypothetical protein
VLAEAALLPGDDAVADPAEDDLGAVFTEPLTRKISTMPMETRKIWNIPGWEASNKDDAKPLILRVNCVRRESETANGTLAATCGDPKTTAVTFFIMNTDNAVASAVQPIRVKYFR